MANMANHRGLINLSWMGRASVGPTNELTHQQLGSLSPHPKATENKVSQWGHTPDKLQISGTSRLLTSPNLSTRKPTVQIFLLAVCQQHEYS